MNAFFFAQLAFATSFWERKTPGVLTLPIIGCVCAGGVVTVAFCVAARRLSGGWWVLHGALGGLIGGLASYLLHCLHFGWSPFVIAPSVAILNTISATLLGPILTLSWLGGVFVAASLRGLSGPRTHSQPVATRRPAR